MNLKGQVSLQSLVPGLYQLSKLRFVQFSRRALFFPVTHARPPESSSSFSIPIQPNFVFFQSARLLLYLGVPPCFLTPCPICWAQLPPCIRVVFFKETLSFLIRWYTRARRETAAGRRKNSFKFSSLVFLAFFSNLHLGYIREFFLPPPTLRSYFFSR